MLKDNNVIAYKSTINSMDTPNQRSDVTIVILIHIVGGRGKI